MTLPAWTLVALSVAAQPAKPAVPNDAARLATLAAAIRAADYRGDRAELSRLASELEVIKDPQLGAYRTYWQGFAKWRRALNGFNETPPPADVKDDLEAGVVHFRAALASRPDWIEAKIGIVGCSSSLLYVAGSDQAAREKILAEFLPLFREMAAQGNDNPRALWLVGGAQLGAPPPYGGDAAKAAATLQKGLEAARNEASANASAPAYQPSWGGAENLMNLAYLYSHSALQNRSLAMAYAEGALVAAPDWHYVRDVLLVQIRALAEPSR